jgi:hypothetical protein
MKINKWFLPSFLVVMIWVVTLYVILPPRSTHAQAIGYVQSGQQAVTASAALLTGMSYGSVCIKALNGNTINVYLGGAGVTDATGMELSPGNSYCAPNNSNTFYIIASTTGASVSWIVSR